ncbi:TrmH family RNA methyltransferase [Urechidicola vernalis]|uniref:RNA methyltransferase n=1 Tax=Urechidicola vernalis TaxID=3075600 RepID=A0ABU2Y1F2_9FLAO|nr:RNA methyltransferase [Urechidicola sp. P050]MDT0552023.1 RNA methyltransferase [Urechidicola sp. P050]
MIKQISSLQNQLIKDLVLLKEKSKVRKKSRRFLIEGKRELELVATSGYSIEKILFEPSLISLETIKQIIDTKELELIEVSNDVYSKIAYRSTTEGVIAVAKSKDLGLNNLKLSPESPLIVVAEAPEKPGNIGALLRTADAANVDAFIIANPRTDMNNPNIIRSSVGCLFTNNVATGTTSEIITFLKERNIRIYCAALKEDSENYTSQNYTFGTAIVVGTEATGLSDQWLNNSDKNIIIPMLGKIDSMNVSVSAGILIYEAKRQRKFI